RPAKEQSMWILIVLVSIALICLVLADAFETTVLPRRVTHRYRLARFFFQSTWCIWRLVTMRFPAGKWRESMLSLFGPWAALAIIVVWVSALVLGFALLHWGLDTSLHGPDE